MLIITKLAWCGIIFLFLGFVWSWYEVKKIGDK